MGYSRIVFYLLFVVLLISCKKDDAPISVNCDRLETGLINVDDAIVIFEIDKLSSDLKPDTTAKDNIGHKENLNTLIDRINNSCSDLDAKLGCYACIETHPVQSQITIELNDTSGIGISRVLDIITSRESVLRCVDVHN